MRVGRVILTTAAIALAGVVGMIVFLYAHDAIEYRLDWYPDLDCRPPDLDADVVRAAFSIAIRQVDGVADPHFQVVSFYRDDEDWPWFAGTLTLAGEPYPFSMEGNGCGVTFSKMTEFQEHGLTVNVSLPNLVIYTFRKGLDPPYVNTHER